MTDIDKVYKGLYMCRNKDCKHCPYERDCTHNEMCSLLKSDALSAVKNKWENQRVKAQWDDGTGHWVEGDRDGKDSHNRTTGEMIDTFRCSWCGYYLYWKTPFCPNCGADMSEA